MDQLTNRPILKLVNDKVLKDAIDNLNSRVNTMSSTAGIVLSGGLMLFQLRAMISNLEKMGKDKSLLENAELGAAAMGATMMVMSASIELSANITQLSAVTKELKMKAASRSLLAATVGLYAGVAELGYLYFYSRNNNSVPQHYLFSNGLAVFAFSVAGRALAEVMAKRTGARLGVMYAFSQAGGIALFANPYFLAGVMIIGLGVSLWSYFKMSVYDDSADNLTNIDYWLDFGAFGKRAFLTADYINQNSYIDPDSGSVVPSFRDAASEVAALAIDMRKNDIEIIIKNSITSTCTITVKITSYLPINEKDIISYEITTSYKPKPKDYMFYSEVDVSSYFKDDVTISGSIPLKKYLNSKLRMMFLHVLAKFLVKMKLVKLSYQKDYQVINILKRKVDISSY